MNSTNGAEPFWLGNARRYLGTAETPGRDTTPLIRAWLIELGAWWRDDETPWCGVFVAHVLRESRIDTPRDYYRALAWREWGEMCYAAELGAVGVFGRQGGGHVGFIVGTDTIGRLMVLGGNQGNRVSVMPLSVDRVLAFRWPTGFPRSHRLPVLQTGAATSINEA